MILIILLVIFVITTIFLIMSNMTKSKDNSNLQRQLNDFSVEKSEFIEKIKKLNNDLKASKEIFKKFKKKNHSDWMRTYERANKLFRFFKRNKDKHKWCFSEIKSFKKRGFNSIPCKRSKRTDCDN